MGRSRTERRDRGDLCERCGAEGPEYFEGKMLCIRCIERAVQGRLVDWDDGRMLNWAEELISGKGEGASDD